MPKETWAVALEGDDERDSQVMEGARDAAQSYITETNTGVKLKRLEPQHDPAPEPADAPLTRVIGHAQVAGARVRSPTKSYYWSNSSTADTLRMDSCYSGYENHDGTSNAGALANATGRPVVGHSGPTNAYGADFNGGGPTTHRPATPPSEDKVQTRPSAGHEDSIQPTQTRARGA